MQDETKEGHEEAPLNPEEVRQAIHEELLTSLCNENGTRMIEIQRPDGTIREIEYSWRDGATIRDDNGEVLFSFAIQVTQANGAKRAAAKLGELLKAHDESVKKAAEAFDEAAVSSRSTAEEYGSLYQAVVAAFEGNEPSRGGYGSSLKYRLNQHGTIVDLVAGWKPRTCVPSVLITAYNPDEGGTFVYSDYDDNGPIKGTTEEDNAENIGEALADTD